MPRTDPDRLLEEALSPRVVALHAALVRLGSCVSFMNTGAHPDDEISALLAALGRRDGLDLSCACATRGEGGQNAIGTEAGADLGTLRTAEMERAARVLDLRLYWLGESPDDTIVDFGFSKSGEETLDRWGRERTLHRFVEIVRTERPDILCTTFLDVPGQHGHHRAMTAAAHTVMDLAADAAHATPGLAPWQPKKLCLPAFGGGGSAYDDELPPPPTTFTIEARGIEPVTGWSFERLGQHSRRLHLTQGMGRWVAAGAERDWPLHLARSEVRGGKDSLVAGLPVSLGELAAFADAPRIAAPLGEAQQAIEQASASPFDFAGVLRAATRALVAVRKAIDVCPPAAGPEVLHRLERKVEQLARVIHLAAGVEVRGRLSREALRPGESADLAIERRDGDPGLGLDIAVEIEPRVGGRWRLEPAGDVVGEAGDGAAVAAVLRVAPDAPPTDPYPASWLPDAPRGPMLEVRVTALGTDSVRRLPLETPPLVLPARSATLSPAAVLLNIAGDSGGASGAIGVIGTSGAVGMSGGRTIELAVTDRHPPEASVSFAMPDGWRVEGEGGRVVVTAPATLEAGLHDIPLRLDGDAARTLRRIDHAHVPPLARATPARLRVRALEVALPEVRIGYVGGGNDRVAHWLRASGLAVTELDDAALGADGAFDALDTLVVGLFALRTRPVLAEAMPRVRRWIEGGGHLLTLYHRPWDDWNPPRPLEIGQPSLRWRVTDERAEVTHLVPDHPLLNTPNAIGPADWDGWHKERGLYFAKRWDPAYEALLSMADPGEAPLEGALLCASLGRGRHTHTSLILHHQMEHLVGGAFRLMANLVA